MSKVGVVQAEGAGEQACLSMEAAVLLNAQSCPQMTKDCRLTPHGQELSVSSAPGLWDSSPRGPLNSCGSLAIGGRRAIFLSGLQPTHWCVLALPYVYGTTLVPNTFLSYTWSTCHLSLVPVTHSGDTFSHLLCPLEIRALP